MDSYTQQWPSAQTVNTSRLLTLVHNEIHHRPLSGLAMVNVVTLKILQLVSPHFHWSSLNMIGVSHGVSGLRAASIAKSTALQALVYIHKIQVKTHPQHRTHTLRELRIWPVQSQVSRVARRAWFSAQRKRCWGLVKWISCPFPLCVVRLTHASFTSGAGAVQQHSQHTSSNSSFSMFI